MTDEGKCCDLCGAGEGERHGGVEGDCILPHRNHSRRLVDGAFVCVPCVDRHRDWLTEIVELYATLADVVLTGSVETDDGEYQKPRKAPASPSPLRLQAWALLRGQLNDHIVDVEYVAGKRVETTRPAYMGSNLPDVPVVLAGWAQAVFDELGWTAPAPDTVSGAAAALRASAEDIVRIPDVDTYDAELRWVRGALLAAHGRSAAGRRPVGRCPSLTGDGQTCGGPLWADPAGRMAVDCGRCNRTFDEAFLRHLGGLLGDTPNAVA